MEGLEGSAPEPPPAAPPPVRLLLAPDDLARSRLTVFFRLLLAIPHFVALALYGIAVVFAVIAAWFAALFTGRVPEGLHGFIALYIRYTTQVNGYVYLVAEPWPAFFADRPYAVDLELPERVRQSRWTVLGRFFLALPALVLSAALAGGGASFSGGSSSSSSTSTTSSSSFSAAFSAVGLLAACAFLAWWVGVFRARAPRGLRDAAAYAIGYAAQVYAFFLLVTPRYPDSDPLKSPAAAHAEPHPVAVANADDLRRSRITVFFRGLLALPHLVWLALWAILALLALIPHSLGTLFTGRPPERIHAFLSRYVAYAVHVGAFLWLAANPFPGFTGTPGTYPVEAQLPGPAKQGRWITFFRWLLILPAFLVGSALGAVQLIAGLLGWWAALVTGRMPEGLRNLSVWALRYNAQLQAYGLLLTERYPYAGPVVEWAPPGAPPVTAPLPEG